MDVFGSDSSDSEEVDRKCSDTSFDWLQRRPSSNGVLAFHNGVERQMLLHVKRTCPPGSGPEAVLSACDRFCYEQHWMMHVGDVKGQMLEKAIQSSFEANPGEKFLCVELGTYCGYSALRIAACLQGLAEGEQGQEQQKKCSLLSMDTVPECVEIANELVEYALGEQDVINVDFKVAPPGEAGQVAADFVSSEQAQGLNFLFIDHDKEAYLSDLLALEPVLKPGATVVADNIGMFDDSVSKYLARVRDPDGQYVTSVSLGAPVEYSDGKGKENQDSMEVSQYLSL